MRPTWNRVVLSLTAIAAMLLTSVSVRAEVIFQDDYTTRPVHGSIYGQVPNIVTTGSGTYQVKEATAELTYANIGTPNGPQSPIGQVLDTTTGYGLTSFYLPYAMDLSESTDILKLTVTFRKPSGGPLGFNNFILGFAGTGEAAGLTDFFRFETNGVLRAYIPGTNVRTLAANTVLENHFDTAINAEEFSTVSLEYDPLKISAQPWSMTWDGEKKDLPKGPTTSYSPLLGIGGVGFGNYNADGGQTRSVWMRDFKFEVIPNPAAAIAGDLNSDGFVGQDDLNLILGNWGQSVPPGDPLADADNSGFIGQDDLNLVLGSWGQGSPPEVAAVPEPASIVLFGLAGFGLVAMRVRLRRAAKA